METARTVRTRPRRKLHLKRSLFVLTTTVMAARTPVVGRTGPANGNGINGNGTNGSGHAATAGADGWAAYIRQMTQARIEIYVDLCKWTADRYAGAVSKQEVQAFLLNVLIGGDKNGGVR